jgi:hypothetical protein
MNNHFQHFGDVWENIFFWVHRRNGKAIINSHTREGAGVPTILIKHLLYSVSSYYIRTYDSLCHKCLVLR